MMSTLNINQSWFEHSWSDVICDQPLRACSPVVSLSRSTFIAFRLCIETVVGLWCSRNKKTREKWCVKCWYYKSSFWLAHLSGISSKFNTNFEIKWSDFKTILILVSFSYLTDNEWLCINNTDCLPLKSSRGRTQAGSVYENQNICRLLCGEFGGLWPRPTRKCNLGKSIIDVNTDLIR